MRKIYLFTLSVLILLSCKENNFNPASLKADREDSVRNLQEAIAFIKQVKHLDQSDPDFILNDKPFTFQYFGCLDELTKDSFLTKEEIIAIRNRKYPGVSRWSNEMFKNVKLVNGDTIEAIFEDHSKGWEYIFETIGSGFSSFSFPVFLRNGTYCLFYSDYNCGWLCGSGRLILYKKEHEKWVELKKYCNWIS